MYGVSIVTLHFTLASFSDVSLSASYIPLSVCVCCGGFGRVGGVGERVRRGSGMVMRCMWRIVVVVVCSPA